MVVAEEMKNLLRSLKEGQNTILKRILPETLYRGRGLKIFANVLAVL